MKTLNNQIIVLAVFTLLALSCSKDDNPPVTDNNNMQTPFQELYDQGVDRYLGSFTPTSSTSTGVVTEYFLIFRMDLYALLVMISQCLPEMVVPITC